MSAALRPGAVRHRRAPRGSFGAPCVMAVQHALGRLALAVALTLALVLVSAVAGARANSRLVATSVNVSAQAGQATVIVDLSEEIPVETVLLSEPLRIVFDLPRVLFLVPPPRMATRGEGLVRAHRFGLFVSDRSRIVLDLAEPALVQRIDFFPIEGGVRMIAQIRRTEAKRFEEMAAAERARVRAQISGDAAPTFGADTAARSGDRASGRPLVVIDPGHGGLDPGAIAPNGVSEKDIVLAVARQIQAALAATGQIESVLTREDDTFVPLDGRVAIARSRRAALMVSIHADIIADEPGLRGASVYTLADRASDAAAARAAEKENRADLAAGIDLPAEVSDSVGDILFDLTRRETRQRSVGFARQLLGNLDRTASTLKKPLRGAGFRVLKAPDVPAVLLELGYMSSPDDLRQLTDPNWQARVAQAVTAAITSFVTRTDSAGSPKANGLFTGSIPAPAPNQRSPTGGR